MKKLLAILFLGALFSCQEQIEPEMIIEEVESVAAGSEIEIVEVPDEEVEIIIECVFDIEEITVEEVMEEIATEVEEVVFEETEVEEVIFEETPEETEVTIEVVEEPRKN